MINVYGDGIHSNLIKNNNKIIMCGSFDNRELKSIFSKIKVLLLPSNYEGFGFVIVEALSHGVPCIVADTFLDSSHLIDDTRGKLLKTFEPKQWVDAINQIMDLPDDKYLELANNCLEFAKTNLSFEIFNQIELD